MDIAPHLIRSCSLERLVPQWVFSGVRTCERPIQANRSLPNRHHWPKPFRAPSLEGSHLTQFCYFASRLWPSILIVFIVLKAMHSTPKVSPGMVGRSPLQASWLLNW